MNPIAQQTIELQRSNWTGSKGNYIQYAYYTGIEAGNPSGSVDNIKTIAYYNGNAEMVFTVTYEFDATDRVVKETCS